MKLKGRTALVTGGSRGIGRAVALALAEEGADVAINYVSNEAAAADVAEHIAKMGRRAILARADVSDYPDTFRMAQDVLREFGHLDILVNNAATPGGLVQGPLEEASEDALLEDINTKVVGYFRCAKAVAPHMQRQGWGRIINIGGLSGRQSGNISGLRNAAIVHLTKTLSDQLGPHGITVNLVHPGTTRTERSGPMYAERARREGVTVEEIERRIAQNIAIRRIVDAKEVGYVVAFLASPKAGAITGEVIAAGGGSQRAVFQ